MTDEDIIKLAIEHTVSGLKFDEEGLVRFANLIASAEREKLDGQIQTLHAMFEVASRQRDYLMDQQRAQVAALRGRIQ